MIGHEAIRKSIRNRGYIFFIFIYKKPKIIRFTKKIFITNGMRVNMIYFIRNKRYGHFKNKNNK